MVFNCQSALWHIPPPCANEFKSSFLVLGDTQPRLEMDVLRRRGEVIPAGYLKRKSAVGLSDHGHKEGVKGFPPTRAYELHGKGLVS